MTVTDKFDERWSIPQIIRAVAEQVDAAIGNDAPTTAEKRNAVKYDPVRYMTKGAPCEVQILTRSLEKSCGNMALFFSRM